MGHVAQGMGLPRPVQVHHDGRWPPGTWRPVGTAKAPWRGLIAYTDPTSTFGWYHWRPAHELRPAMAEELEEAIL